SPSLIGNLQTSPGRSVPLAPAGSTDVHRPAGDQHGAETTRPLATLDARPTDRARVAFDGPHRCPAATVLRFLHRGLDSVDHDGVHGLLVPIRVVRGKDDREPLVEVDDDI